MQQVRKVYQLLGSLLQKLRGKLMADKTYKMTVTLSNGNTVDAGTFIVPEGEQGIKGDTGPQGPTGTRGDKGIIGEQGPQGDKGDKGNKGATGATGPQGVSISNVVITEVTG